MRVLQDVFPAVVSMTTTEPTPEAPLTAANPASSLNARRLDRARVITTDERIIVAMDSPEGPVIVFNQAYDQDTVHIGKGRSSDSTLTTLLQEGANQIYVAYRKSEDCSCGSRLRGWRPFGSTYSVTSSRN